MKKRFFRFIATVCIAFAYGLVWKTSTCNNQSALIDSMVEALADDEGGASDPTMPCIIAVSVCEFTINDANGNSYIASVSGFRHI